jgi:hypothetical protein
MITNFTQLAFTAMNFLKKGICYYHRLWCIKGNPVKFGNEPVAVTGDKHGKDVTDRCKKDWEGAVSRKNRKSENLPGR